MLMIRFQRIGRVNDPAFRIVLIEKERAAKAGNIVEQLGTYNPRSKALTLDGDKVKGWMSKGAQPTDSIRNLLISQKIIEGKKVNVLPKKTPLKPAASEAAGSGEQSAEQTVLAAENIPPTEAEVAAEAEPAPEEAETKEEVSVADEPAAESAPEEDKDAAPAA